MDIADEIREGLKDIIIELHQEQIEVLEETLKADIDYDEHVGKAMGLGSAIYKLKHFVKKIERRNTEVSKIEATNYD